MKSSNTAGSSAESSLQLLEAVGRSDEKQIHELLSAGADIRAKDSQSRSALLIALERGHEVVIGLLLATAKKTWSPEEYCESLQYLLHESITLRNESMLQILLKNGGTPLKLSLYPRSERGALHTAAEKGHSMITKILLERGASSGTKSSENETPLSIVIDKGHHLVAKILLESDGGAQVRSTYVRRALYNAVVFKEDKLVDLLIEYGAPVDGIEGVNIMSQAIQTNQIRTVKLLIGKGAEINERGTLNRGQLTPLHRAVKQAAEHSDALSVEMVQVLI